MAFNSEQFSSPAHAFERAMASALAVAMLAFLLPASLRAAGGAAPPDDVAPSITLTPAVVMVKAKPGQTFSQDFTIYNNSTRQLVFDLQAEDVVVKDGQRAFLPAGEAVGSIARTAVFSYPMVVVAPGGYATTTVMVTIPLVPGPRAIACVFVGRTITAVHNSLAITGSLGALVTFTISDDFQVANQPIQVDIDTDAQSIVFRQTLKNVGADPVVPSGAVAVTDDGGNLVVRLPMPVKRLLPGESTELAVQHAGLFKPGRYRVTFLEANQGSLVSNFADFTIK